MLTFTIKISRWITANFCSKQVNKFRSGMFYYQYENGNKKNIITPILNL